jgi:putative ATP-dependent endonuclease of OLD family
MDIELGVTNLLIGQNNTGKSNFLRAINIALGATTDVSDADIFVAHNERLQKTKGALIDIMLRPTDLNGKIDNNFTDFWTGVFTESWITTSTEGAFVGIRTEIKLDIAKDNYVISRRCIRQWNNSLETAQLEAKRLSFTEDMRQYISSFYMDANRDIVQDLRNRKSFFGRVTSGYNMTEDKVKEIEEQLSSVNAMIIESIPSLQQTKDRIAAIGRTIGSSSSNVEIEPLTRKLSDLNRGMDIVMQDGGASFPISQNGYGTRSWISFLTLSAFVENQTEKIKADDDEAEQYVMLTMEEPEAHLHPQAQRQLYSQIQKFTGQKVISTHSPSVVAQSALADYIHFSKQDGKTAAVHYKANHTAVVSEEKIAREVLNTRAELLFSSAIILCEGITEELALPVYFNEYFGSSSYSLGVDVIGIGGQNYKTYLSLIKDFEIPWFIYGDGEVNAITSVRTAVQDVFGEDYQTLNNVIIIDNGNDYEKHLIDEGYSEIMIEAICKYENEPNFFVDYIRIMNGQNGRGGVKRNYGGATGRISALKDLCRENKANYALPVAKEIVAIDDVTKRIPRLIKKLFDELSIKLGLDIAARANQAEE